MRRNERGPLLMLISSMLIFGTIGVFRRYIPFSSAFLAMVRGLLGGLLVIAWVRFSGRRAGLKTGRLPGRVTAKLALTGAVMGFNWILLFEAYNRTTVGVATLCYYMEPTIVTLLSPLLFRERLGAKKILCALAAVAGMVLVSGVTEENRAGVNPQGVLLGLGAAVLYSAVVILNKKTPGVDAYQKTTVQLLSAGLVMIPYLLLTGGFPSGPCDARAVILLLVVGVVHTGIAYVLYFGCMDRLRAQSIAIFSYIDPVSALLFSAFLLKEPLSAAGIAGAVLIIGSAIISELHGKEQNP